ncbi:MAG: hypothetical protein Fur0044_22590 [Anaerolineae bacterium]|nr:hypothetical protein [Anaerolineales bacterium]MCQ3975718.1 hypothetical protein [Anaerolineae bacterium]
MDDLNPGTANPAIAERRRQDFRDTVRVAEKIGARRVVTFSGCPGDSDDNKYPETVVLSTN